MDNTGERVSLLNELHQIQQEHGFISREAIETLAEQKGCSPSELFGFISFFNSFRIHPKGKIHISLCYGTACYIRGAKLIYERLVDEFKLDKHGTSEDGLVTVETVYCVGSCSCAPVVVHEDEQMGRMNIQRTLALLRDLIEQEMDARQLGQEQTPEPEMVQTPEPEMEQAS